MINDYLQVAIKSANYKIYNEDNSIFGEIPSCRGVIANANTFEECRKELLDVLEGWILLRMRKNLYIPVIENIDLNIPETEDATY